MTRPARHRPAAIVRFERLMLAALALLALQVWLDDGWLTVFEKQSPTTGFIVVAALVVGTLRVSRRRSKIALWLLVALFLLGLPAAWFMATLARVGAVTGIVLLVDAFQMILQLVALSGLFTVPARRWMNGEPTLQDLGNTFA